jgi:hypothetical protein
VIGKMRRNIYVTVSIVAIALMLSLAFGPQPVKAQGEPMVYVDSLLYRAPAQQPLTSPVIIPAVTSLPATKTIYVKIARAPHESTEPALDTDKTFSAGFTLTYDTSMFQIASLSTDVTEEPASVTTAAQFLKRRMYAFDADGSITGTPEMWYLSGFYTTSFAKGEATLGTLTVGGTIIAPSPTTVPLPPEYVTYSATAPDSGRHAGSNYDLPYTENATQAKLQADGSTITDPSYCLLAIIKFTAIAVPSVDYPGSIFQLSDVIMLQGDTTTNYFYSSGGTTMDGYYVQVPLVPEFPLGLGIVTSLATLIPVIYLWRRRPKKKME